MNDDVFVSLVKLMILIALPAFLLVLVAGPHVGGRLATHYIELIVTLPFRVMGYLIDAVCGRR